MLDAWLLAFCRFVPVVALHPLFGGRGVPRTVVVGVASALAAVAAARCPLAPASGLAALALSGVEELAVGATIALLGQCVFGAIEAAGRFVDDARGANVAHLFAPQIEAVASPLGQLELSAALAVFWGSGAYRPTVEGLLGSFDAVPFGAGSPPSLEAALAVADALARAAFALAGPAAASCVLVDVGMGLVNRASPNANAFLLAQPVKLAAAVIVTAAGAPARLGIWASLLRDHDAWLRRLAGS